MINRLPPCPAGAVGGYDCAFVLGRFHDGDALVDDAAHVPHDVCDVRFCGLDGPGKPCDLPGVLVADFPIDDGETVYEHGFTSSTTMRFSRLRIAVILHGHCDVAAIATC